MDPHAHPAGFFREREVRDIQPGGHLCHVFDTTEQSLAVLVPFLADGLEAGDRCVSDLAETPIEDVRRALEERGIDTDARIAEGDLVLRPAREGYGEPEAFDVQERIDALEAQVWEAREDGYENLRSAGEMSWAAGDRLDRETLARYEAELNRLFEREAGQHVLGLCQYHLSVFEPEVAADVLRAHPLTINGTRVRPNLFYQPPDVLLADDPQAEVDHILDRLSQEPEDAEVPRGTLEELEERNDRLRGFHETTSEEMKRALQALKAHLERAEESVGKPWPHDAETAIEYAVEGAGRIEERIEALVEYSRLETQGLELSRTDSREALEGARSRLASRLEREGVQLSHDPLPNVEADGEQLARLFEHLLADLLENGGPSLSRVHVAVDETDEAWTFSFEHDGRGMPEGERERLSALFERDAPFGFERDTDPGLALCERIVDCHGGLISVGGSSSSDARFAFTIPKPESHADS